MRKLSVLAAILCSLIYAVSLHADGNESESAFQKHFTWGADVGGSIDMTGNDMSTVDLAANVGYKNDFLRLLGIGANLNMMVSNSNRSFPIYAVVRTNFRKKPTFCFLDAKGGISINYFPENVSQTGLYLSGGVGFNLASGRTFRSHIIISYSYIERKDIKDRSWGANNEDLHLVSLKIGVSF